MHSSTLFLLVAASLGLATDCNVAVEGCVSSVNVDPCPTDLVMIADPCHCSKAAQVVSCYSSICPGQPQAYFAASAYSAICSGSLPDGSSAMSTSLSYTSSLSSAAAATVTTGTDTLATASATGTGTGAIGGVTTAPASGSRSSARAGGSAAPASTSKAWGERSLVLPAGGAMAAVLGLAILL